MLHLRLIVTLVAAFSGIAGADVVFVDDDNCPGPGSGTELDPFCSIQTAIDNAVNADEILVAPGTYFETINFLGKAITLRSYDGPDVTTIDGTGNFHVVQCVSGEGPATILDGFTITGGNATIPNNTGGGMYNSGSSPTVINCTFSGNSANAGGGGMYNLGASNPTVTDCTFIGNTAGNGAGMANASASNPTVTNCSFSDNIAWSEGGGMYNVVTSPTVTNCSFDKNTAGNRGGGMYNTNGSHPTVTDCSFSGNTATNDFGGGMYIVGSLATITNCTFTGNTACCAGGMLIDFFSSPVITNCTFSGNTTTLGPGGAILISFSSSPTMTNCTFTMNSATTGNAVGFVFGPNSMTMSNCILWDDGDEIWNDDRSTIAIDYSNVQGGFPGTGNIDADPQFVDPDNGDYRLASGSPCIDAGDNTAVPAGITTDLDGNPRFVDDPDTIDSGNGDPPIVDMGAYEFQGVSVCPWDCGGDNNGNVGINDFLAVLAQWGSPGSCDFDGGGVGINDFLDLLANWGPCP